VAEAASATRPPGKTRPPVARHGARALVLASLVVPLLAWLVVGPGRLRWGLALLVPLSLCFGPEVTLGKHTLPMPHYQAAAAVLPFFHRLTFPQRAQVVVLVFTSLATGLVGARVGRAWPRWAPVLAVAWVVLAFTGLRTTRLYPLSRTQVEVPDAASWMAAQGEGAVVHLPFGTGQFALQWQLEAYLPHVGGMGESEVRHWPPGFAGVLSAPHMESLVWVVRRPGRDPTWTGDTTSRLLEDRIRWVVFHRDLAESDISRWDPRGRAHWPGKRRVSGVFAATDRLVELLGAPVAQEGPALIWDLEGRAVPPPDLTLAPQGLRHRTWDPRPLPWRGPAGSGR